MNDHGIIFMAAKLIKPVKMKQINDLVFVFLWKDIHFCKTV